MFDRILHANISPVFWTQGVVTTKSRKTCLRRVQKTINNNHIFYSETTYEDYDNVMCIMCWKAPKCLNLGLIGLRNAWNWFISKSELKRTSEQPTNTKKTRSPSYKETWLNRLLAGRPRDATFEPPEPQSPPASQPPSAALPRLRALELSTGIIVSA